MIEQEERDAGQRKSDFLSGLQVQGGGGLPLQRRDFGGGHEAQGHNVLTVDLEYYRARYCKWGRSKQ